MTKDRNWVLVSLSDVPSNSKNGNVLMPKRVYKPEMGTILKHLTNEDDKVKSHWNVWFRRGLT